MGCCMSTTPFRKDEIRPISIIPINVTDKMTSSNGFSPSVHGKPRDATPTREIIATRETTQARAVTPPRDATPAMEATQGREVTPARVTTPTREVTPARVATPTKDATPAREAIPAREANSAGEITHMKEENTEITNGNEIVPAEPASTDGLASLLEVMRVPDGEGTPITLAKLFGAWTAPMPSLPEQIMRAQSFTFHDSDVILLGYSKSGSHWLWEMIHMLMKGRPEYCRTPKERLMLSFSSQEFFDTLEPPRVFNCHAPWYGLPPAITGGQNKCKMIYILRNPKDVAVSFYHQLKAQKIFDYEGSFHGFLDLFLEGKVPGGSWFDYVLGWEETIKNNAQLPILVLFYEDIKEDTVAALRRVNSFLQTDRNEELLQEIADKCTIGKMRQVDEEMKEHLEDHPNISKNGKNFMYRKGEVGDWMNWFSVADNQRFEKVIKRKLKDSRLTFRYDLEQNTVDDD